MLIYSSIISITIDILDWVILSCWGLFCNCRTSSSSSSGLFSPRASSKFPLPSQQWRHVSRHCQITLCWQPLIYKNTLFFMHITLLSVTQIDMSLQRYCHIVNKSDSSLFQKLSFRERKNSLLCPSASLGTLFSHLCFQSTRDVLISLLRRWGNRVQ